MLFSKCEGCGNLVNEKEQERQRTIMVNMFQYTDNKCLCPDCRKTTNEIKNLLKESI